MQMVLFQKKTRAIRIIKAFVRIFIIKLKLDGVVRGTLRALQAYILSTMCILCVSNVVS